MSPFGVSKLRSEFREYPVSSDASMAAMGISVAHALTLAGKAFAATLSASGFQPVSENVGMLSLFDGIAAARERWHRLGRGLTGFAACEVEPAVGSVAHARFPADLELNDIRSRSASDIPQLRERTSHASAPLPPVGFPYSNTGRRLAGAAEARDEKSGPWAELGQAKALLESLWPEVRLPGLMEKDGDLLEADRGSDSWCSALQPPLLCSSVLSWML